MPQVLGLRSPYARVGRHVYLGRMLDKIRLQARGELPADFAVNVGESRAPLLDARCCRFFGLPHAQVAERTLQGGADEEVLRWIETQTRVPSDEECAIWNAFMIKLGWRDERTAILRQRYEEYGRPPGTVETFFDLLDVDEGRDPLSSLSWEPKGVDILVVMGVSGCGKSAVGQALATRLGWDFLDGDDFHPTANVEKMRSGHPLNDDDRAPWLAALHQKLAEQEKAGRGSVLACSALKERYRTTLMPNQARLRFVHLCGDRSILQERLAKRPGHFMPASLLDSQFAALERPLYALDVDIAVPIREQCDQVCNTLRL